MSLWILGHLDDGELSEPRKKKTHPLLHSTISTILVGKSHAQTLNVWYVWYFYLRLPKDYSIVGKYTHMLHGTGILTSRHFHLFMARHVSL